MKQFNAIFLFAFSFLSTIFISCENEIPFKTKDIPQKLVISALMNANNEENKIILNLTGTEQITPVKNGEVRIFLNGSQKETIHAADPETDWVTSNVYISRLRYTPGDIVRVEASTDDGKYNAYADITVTRPLEIQKNDTMTVSNTTGNK